MKNLSFILISSLLLSANLYAESKLMKNLGSLGANKKIIKRVNELDPENKIRIVQKRLVDRNSRVEINMGYGFITGGDPALSTKVLNANLEYHLNPKWSLGLRYTSYDNDPSSSEIASLDQGATRSDLDLAKQSNLVTLSWYPLYGKMNMLDMGIAQFDLYTLVGLGQIELDSGKTSMYSVGMGLGMWMNKYISTRLELRYQGYKDVIYTGERNIDQTVISASIGFLL